MIFQDKLLKSLCDHKTRIAIDYGAGTVTYAQLDERSKTLSKQINKRIAASNPMIGIMLKDRVTIVSSIIGVLRSGGIFVLLDPSSPLGRLNDMLNDVKPKLLITSDDIIREVGQELPDVPKLIYEHAVDKENDHEDAAPDVSFDENDTVYVYFTSGSTGKPKGILGKNKSLLHFLEWEIRTFNLDNNLRVSQFISPYFDAFLRDIFVPLLVGGTVCIPSDDSDFFTSEKIQQWIDECQINLIHCVPSLFNVISGGKLSSAMFKSLKYILLSGEKILPPSLSNWYSIFNDRIQLVNLYGATETTMIRTCYKIRPEDSNLDKIPIGDSIDDTELRVVDEHMKPNALLVPGEILVISEYISNGYINGQESDNDKFLRLEDHPGSPYNAYRTGDYGRTLSNGHVELLGREDRQVKINGIRIELDDVETNISKLEHVYQTAVIVSTDVSPDQAGDAPLQTNSLETHFLIGFVVKSPNTPTDIDIPEYVTSQLSAYVPEYMIPTQVVEIERIPLLSNGKVDFTQLKKLLTKGAVVPPDNDTEKRLLKIWKDILGDKAISTADVFHRIGGNSIATMRLITKIFNEFGVRISLYELFANNTIKKQSEFIQQNDHQNVFQITKAEEKTRYHLSSAQESMFYNYQLDEKGTSYNMPMVWEIVGDLNIEKIENTVAQLIQRHESLRTEIKVLSDAPYQIIRDSVDFEVELIRTKEPLKAAITQFVRPFDLQKAPIFRCGIIQTQDGKNVIAFDVHHMVCDGLSSRKLLIDFLNIYRGQPQPPINLTYKDYAEWEFKFRNSQDYLNSREFWLKSFEKGIPKFHFPIEKKESYAGLGDAADRFFEVDNDIIRAVLSSLEEDGVSYNSTLLALYYLFLAEISGQEEIVVGTVSSGRLIEGVNEIVGMFAKSLPVKYQIVPKHSFRDFAKELNNYISKVNSHQFYVMTDVIKHLQSRKLMTSESLFDVGFVFQTEHPLTQPDNIEFIRIDAEVVPAKLPLIFHTVDEYKRILLRFEYSTVLFEEQDIDFFVNLFRKLIRKVADNMDQPIEGLTEVTKDSSLHSDINFNF